jgi:hypothetical protein
MKIEGVMGLSVEILCRLIDKDIIAQSSLKDHSMIGQTIHDYLYEIAAQVELVANKMEKAGVNPSEYTF